MTERVVVLGDAEIQALIDNLAFDLNAIELEAEAKLRKALEQPQGEVRTEYRVVYLNAFTLYRTHGEAETAAAEMRREGTATRIQSRTVLKTEWTDIDQQEGDE